MITQIAQQGWSQQTPAARAIMGAGLGSRSPSSPRRKRRSRAAAGKKPKKRASTSRSSGKSSKLKRLVKGSAAAKRFMAKIRKMRGK